MLFFIFTESDLLGKRDGRLSDGQKRKLLTRTTGTIKEKLVAVLIAFPVVLTMTVWHAFSR
jgi:hypothetical protein